MKEEIIKLKTLREEKESMKLTYDQALKSFENENKDLLNRMAKNKAQTLLVEGTLRAYSIDQYSKTGEKKFEFGLGVKIMNRLIYDPADAFNWAKEKGIALMLNKKSFEAFAKNEPIAFVKIEEVASATIPTKLVVD